MVLVVVDQRAQRKKMKKSKRNWVVKQATVLYPFIDWIPDDFDYCEGCEYLILSPTLRIKLDENTPSTDIMNANTILDTLRIKADTLDRIQSS